MRSASLPAASDRMREGLAAREQQIVRLAYRDELTDLPIALRSTTV